MVGWDGIDKEAMWTHSEARVSKHEGHYVSPIAWVQRRLVKVQ